MNRKRRNELQKIIIELGEINSKINELMEALNDLKYEEEEALDNLPESLQESEKGQRIQEAIDYLDNAIYELENLDSGTNEVEEYLQNAIDC